MKQIKKYAEIIDEKIIWEDIKGWTKEVTQLFEGRKIECIFKVRTNKRTLAQNNWLWGVAYKIMASYFTEWNGQEFDEKDIHSICKKEFLPRVMETETRQAVDGNGEVVEFEHTTTKLTTVQFNAYKEWIQVWGSEMDVVIPDPDQEFPELKPIKNKERLIDIDKAA